MQHLFRGLCTIEVTLYFCIGFMKLEWQGKKRVEQQLTFSILTSPLCAADSSLASTTRTAWHRSLVTSWRPCRCLEWRRRAARSLRMFRARSIWPKTVTCSDNMWVAMTTAVSTTTALFRWHLGSFHFPKEICRKNRELLEIRWNQCPKALAP